MLKPSNFVKIVVYVPVDFSNKVQLALSQAGAGVQGNYDSCSSSYRTVGRFKPLKGAKPAIGSIGKLEQVAEEAIEVICREDLVEKAIIAVKAVHPYEEPAIDILPRLEII